MCACVRALRACVRACALCTLPPSVETRFGSFSLLLQLVPSLPRVLHSVMYELLSTLMTQRGWVHPFFLFSFCFFFGFGYVHRSSLSFNFDLSRRDIVAFPLHSQAAAHHSLNCSRPTSKLLPPIKKRRKKKKQLLPGWQNNDFSPHLDF